MTLLDREIAIPFAAFAPRHDEAEDIDVLADEIDGTVVAAEPAPSAAAAVRPRSMKARPGRVMISIEASPATAEEVVDHLLDQLADAEMVAPGIYASRNHEHHDPADLVYWAAVDAAKGRLATALDIVVCTQRMGTPARTYVTVDGPARLLEAFESAAEAGPDPAPRALLTAAGTVSPEAVESDVVLAAALHAHRLAGRADAFPGQEWLVDDLPVADVLARTAIDEVRSTRGAFARAAVLRAHGFVRPSYEDGALVLTVGHDDPLVVTPWEVRYCRPCCGAEH